jgi:hypothetical protein
MSFCSQFIVGSEYQSLLTFARTHIPPFVLSLIADGAKFLIGAGFGWLFKAGRDRWRTRHARSMWRPFLSNDLCIVLGRFKEFGDFERSGLFGVGDVIALAELQRFLTEMGAPNVEVIYADELKGDGLKRTIIAIGGPEANSVTKDAFGLFGPRFIFGKDTKEDATILDTAVEPPIIYSPNNLETNRRGTDYGLILSGSNPFSAQKMMMIIAGCFGYGTWAGTRYVISEDFLKIRSTHESEPFECLIQTDVVRDTPQSIRLLKTRKLTD